MKTERNVTKNLMKVRVKNKTGKEKEDKCWNEKKREEKHKEGD